MDVKKWSADHFQEINLNLQDAHSLAQLMLTTLDNFAHRYFEEASKSNQIDSNTFSVDGKNGEQTKYNLSIIIKNSNNFKLVARKNHQENEYNLETKDLLELRNSLAKHLEEISVIF